MTETTPTCPTQPLTAIWQRYRQLLWAAAIATCCIVSFAGNMHRGLTETTEGRYAECAREMLETGNFLTPTLDYTPHWTKPPLAYWGMAAGMALLGPNEAGARLSSAVAFVVTGAATAWIAWSLWGEMTAWLALCIFSSSLLPVLGATMLSTDMLLTMWETLAVACYVAWTTTNRTSRMLTGCMWAAFGLAFLTKGPPALLPLLGLVPWHVWRYRDSRIFSWPGLFLFALPAFGWFGLVIWANPGLLSYFIHDEIVNRVASDAFHRNAEWYKPLTIYFPVLVLGQMHWLWLARRDLRGLSREHGLLLGLWLGLPLVVLCLSKSRLPLYVLPLAVPVALIAASALGRRATTLPGRTVLVVTGTAMLLLCGARFGAGLIPLPQNMLRLHQTLALAQTEAPLVAVMKDKTYGLQFYAQGKITWMVGDAAQRREAITAYATEQKEAFRVIVHDGDEPWLRELLETGGRAYTVLSTEGWRILCVEGVDA